MNNKELKGFTLIELLVVVLIIGILAAIALPQYNKATERARISEAVINLKAIAEANKIYFLINGSYAQSISDIDITIPGGKVAGSGGGDYRIESKYFTYSPHGSSGINDGIAVAQRHPFKEYYYFKVLPNKPGIECVGYSQKGKDICNDLIVTNSNFYK
jgi:prepilin-type N-terminal cleavage/methylation domain-containing protein